jgi:hypothetical protein
MIAFVLGGYAVLMVLAQPRLSLVYSRLSFSPGFWAFTFSYSAVVLLLGRRRRRPGLAGAEEAAGRNRLRDRGPDPADRLHRLDRRPHDAAGRPRPALSRILTWPDQGGQTP